MAAESSIVPLIPGIMYERGFLVGERLLKKWLSADALTPPRIYGQPVTDISWDWLLGFKRAKDLFNQFEETEPWDNLEARVPIYSVMSQHGLLDENAHSFDYLQSPRSVRENHINHLKQGYVTAIDDLNAALGRFTFYQSIKGSVKPERQGGADGHMVAITDIGICMRDSYDFDDWQPLGFWNREDKTVSLNPFSGEYVGNSTFQAWRKKSFKGEDFEVFTQVKSIHLSTSVKHWFRLAGPLA